MIENIFCCYDRVGKHTSLFCAALGIYKRFAAFLFPRHFALLNICNLVIVVALSHWNCMQNVFAADTIKILKNEHYVGRGVGYHDFFFFF